MRAIIFANGNPPARKVVERWLTPTDRIIAADGVARNALRVNVMPHVIIGDLDSLQAADRFQLERLAVQFVVYPTRKDCTDLELAIRYALAQGASEIVAFSALGGRWDQSLANLMLLTLPELDRVPARIVDRDLTIMAIRDRAEIAGQVGDTLSLLALKGDARGVTIEGCEYPLVDARLPFGATLGISNVLTEAIAKIAVKEGLVLVMHKTNFEGDQ